MPADSRLPSRRRFLGGAAASAAALCLPRVAVAMPSLTAAQIPAMVGRYRGSVVIVHFWATWCPSCRDAYPRLNALAGELGGRGLTVLAMAIDQNVEFVNAFVQSHPSQWVDHHVQRWRPGELTAAVAALGASYPDKIPYSAIFDRDGDLVRDYLGAQSQGEYRRIVEPLLAAAAEQAGGWVRRADGSWGKGL